MPDCRTHALVRVHSDAAVQFLETVFDPSDWVAVFLKSYERSGVAQRVGPVSWVKGVRFQGWLRAMNARKYNIFISVNAIAPGRRSRTRNAIGEVRHVFLDADDDGPAVLSHVDARKDLPSPSYVLHSSPNHVHVFWRVMGFDKDLVERLQKQLARELQTDPVATPVTQNTRLPGFFNHKRAQPHLVTIEYRNVDATKAGGLSAGQQTRCLARTCWSPRFADPRVASRRTGKAVPGLSPPRHCWRAWRRPHISCLLQAHQRVRAER